MSKPVSEILKPQRAFLEYVKENYSLHPIGALALAVEIYETCRTNSDSFFWEIMAAQGKSWDSQSFLNAANLIIEVSKNGGSVLE